MKKQLLSLCLPAAMAFATVPASAATLLGFEAGVYTWQTSTSGSYDGVDTSGFKDSDNTVTYFAFEHPVPIVPNIKLQMTDMVSTTAGSSVDLSNTDSTLYYEILDNSLISVDIGLTARAFSGEYNNAGTVTAMNDTSYLMYASAVIGIPGTGLSIGMETSQSAGLDKNEINDIKIRLSYEIMAGLGVELGQRTVTMTLEESAPNTQSLEFDGTYLALTYTF